MISAALKERFLKDDPSRRLGNLAANLARMESFSEQPDHRDAVRHIAEESAFFIEWAAPDAEPEIQGDLLQLQRLLVGWTRTWDVLWDDPCQRQTMRDHAGQWAQHLLRLAGLVP